MIGDSHFVTETFLIRSLPEALLEQGAKSATYGACGVPSGVWVMPRAIPCGISERIGTGPIRVNKDPKAENPTLSELIAKIHPNALIVVNGDTMASYRSKLLPAESINFNVGALVAQIKAENIPCVWVGPGWGSEGGPMFKTYARAKEMADLLRTIVAPCHYVDSMAFSKPGEWRTFDGVHYTLPSYDKWAAALTQVLVENVRVFGLVKK
jgi:hypothetical protein